MQKSVFALVLFASVFAGAATHARGICRKSAVSTAKLAAPGYNVLFDLNPFDETPDMISYEVTFADVLPDPHTTKTIEVTLSKATCALISDPVQK